MKYNVGDKVRIKPKFHFCSVDGFNNINMKDEFFNEYSRLPYCETVMTISTVNKDFYTLKEDRWAYKWTDEMIEGLVEKETKPCTNINDMNNDAIIIPTSAIVEMVKELGVSCPDGYIFKDENGNIINATKIVLEKKKNEYPKTYEECCKVLNVAVRDLDILDNMLDTTEIIYRKNLDRLLNSFRKLLICRDAYWKIAGEEMGLGEPWKPDWTNEHQLKYTIYTMGNDVIRHVGNYIHAILAFPTEEMRDAFKENFKEEIEQCKELL